MNIESNWTEETLTGWYKHYNGLDWSDTEINPYGFRRGACRGTSILMAKFYARRAIEGLCDVLR